MDKRGVDVGRDDDKPWTWFDYLLIVLVGTLFITLLVGCVPAAMYSHDSDPRRGRPFNDDVDSSTDFLGAGGCIELSSTDICTFLGARHERSDTEETGLAAQFIALRKFRGRE